MAASGQPQPCEPVSAHWVIHQDLTLWEMPFVAQHREGEHFLWTVQAEGSLVLRTLTSSWF